MRPNLFRVLAVVSLVACLVLAAHGAENNKGYIYDAKGVGDNRAIVINPVTRGVGIQDKSVARTDATAGEFGGTYWDCGNESFFCLTGSLEIVIPKSMRVMQWQYHGLSCQGVGEPKGDVVRITCRSRNYRGKPTFTYSLSRGVLSIDSSPVGGGRERYELRGQRGLFSPGNNP